MFSDKMLYILSSLGALVAIYMAIYWKHQQWFERKEYALGFIKMLNEQRYKVNNEKRIEWVAGGLSRWLGCVWSKKSLFLCYGFEIVFITFSSFLFAHFVSTEGLWNPVRFPDDLPAIYGLAYVCLDYTFVGLGLYLLYIATDETRPERAKFASIFAYLLGFALLALYPFFDYIASDLTLFERFLFLSIVITRGWKIGLVVLYAFIWPPTIVTTMVPMDAVFIIVVGVLIVKRGFETAIKELLIIGLAALVVVLGIKLYMAFLDDKLGLIIDKSSQISSYSSTMRYVFELIAWGNYVLYLLVLPLVNAICDWVSLSVSRKLLMKMKTANGGAMLLYLALDLFCALILSAILVFSLIFSTQFIDEMGVAPISVLSYLDYILSGQERSVEIWALLFVFTTLIPNLILALWLCYTILISSLPDVLRKRIVKFVRLAVTVEPEDSYKARRLTSLPSHLVAAIKLFSYVVIPSALVMGLAYSPSKSGRLYMMRQNTLTK